MAVLFGFQTVCDRTQDSVFYSKKPDPATEMSLNALPVWQGLDQFEVVTFHLNRKRSAQQFNRYHQTLILSVSFEDAFHSVETPAANSHAVADFDVGVRQARNLFPNRRAETFNFFLADRSSLALISHEPQNSLGPNDLQTILGCGRDSNEGVTAEKRNFHFGSAVAPPVDLLEQGKERVNSLLSQLPGDSLFVSWHGVNGIPIRFLPRACGMENGRRVRQIFLQCGHSFAL
jgi:hypothetical protein